MPHTWSFKRDGNTTPSAGYPFQVMQASWSGEQVDLPAEGERRVQLESWLTEEAARQLVQFAGHDLDKLIASARSRNFQPVPLGVTTSIAFTNTLKRSQTANVYGVLRGSDPKPRDEYVIYTAHHDHLAALASRTRPARRFTTAHATTLRAIATQFKALPQPPRRSVMFLLVAAEEQGLLGSQYFASHLTMPTGRIAANLNYDGGNHVQPREGVSLPRFLGYLDRGKQCGTRRRKDAFARNQQQQRDHERHELEDAAVGQHRADELTGRYVQQRRHDIWLEQQDDRAGGRDPERMAWLSTTRRPQPGAATA
jgi:hypothetical protein